MKIFGIGLSKTGTTSLASALEMLGFKVKDYPGIQIYHPGDLASIDPALLQDHDALTDTPIPSFYKELDRAYPGSKFILTVRERNGWLRSCAKQFTEKLAAKQTEAHNQLFMDLYGTTIYDEKKFSQGYDRFVNGVMEYFKDRPGDLLVLDITAGEGWEKLCPFLNKPIPDVPFPKANVTRIRWMDIQDLVNIAQEAGKILRVAHIGMSGGWWRASLRQHLPAIGWAAVSSISAGRARRGVATRSLKIIEDGLRRLNVDIPIISALHHDQPLDQRKTWNHFWLVDPLDGEDALGTVNGRCSVNIALIEDMRPIAGVVHDPLNEITLYAMIGKGAYLSIAGRETAKLDEASTASVQPTLIVPYDNTTQSIALSLCQHALPGADSALYRMPSMEWQSAAAHAIARLCRRRFITCSDGLELRYNKPDWTNSQLCID